MNIASWVTLSRLFLVLPAILPVAAGWDNGWFTAAVVTALAGFTDVFDGYLARKTGHITSLGSNLDLISDKVFIGAMFGLAAWFGLIPLWIPAIIILREVIISLVRLTWPHNNLLAPDFWGKTKTAVSFTAIVMIFTLQDLKTGGIISATGAQTAPTLLLSLTQWCILTAVVLTVFSGVNYLLKATTARAGIESKTDSISA